MRFFARLLILICVTNIYCRSLNSESMVIGLYKQGKINELITRPMVQSFARALSSLTEKFYKPERFLEGFQTVNMCDSEICSKKLEKALTKLCIIGPLISSVIFPCLYNPITIDSEFRQHIICKYTSRHPHSLFKLSLTSR